MAVRIYIEIGHEASIRTKKTQEGFTHDWEVFVRGCDGAEIHYFIEKVVFYLHETFPKPRRVIKEPPYSVKESGYAGFNLPIDIYLRNNSEPKKIRFNYDLHLQQTGPAIIKVQKEKYVFNSPTEEFKLKLLKSGGLIGSSSSIQELSDSRSSFDEKIQMINKPKLSGSADLMKKPKIKAGEPCRDFQELFGSPIFTSSKAAEVKLVPPKQDPKNSEKPRAKHSPHKDKDKPNKTDADKKSKDDKKSKERTKDRERSKDKSLKKEKSPRPKSPSPKRSPKRLSSPPRFSSPPVTSSKHKDKESGKHADKDSRREKFDEIGARKSKKEKRSKEHRESKHGDEQKRSGTNDDHGSKVRGDSKTKDRDSKNNKTSETKSVSSSPPPPPPKVVEQKEKPKSASKESINKEGEKSHDKYKHKKKDKDREKREKKEDKAHKSDKKSDKSGESKVSLFKTEPIKKEKVVLPPAAPPLLDEDSSSSSSSSSGSSIVVEKRVKVEKVKEEKTLKVKKEKVYQEGGIKCKRKSNSVDKEEPLEKVPKEQQQSLNNNSDLEQDVKGNIVQADIKQEEEDYFGVLRDLQHKIMGLKDNSDLQKVVQLIAETGRYEVSAHTFDFDLCLLERSTVQQLQEFFANNDT